MVVSYVVRLIPEQLSKGRFVGEVEDVVTGEVSTIRGLEELARALRSVTEQPSEDGGRR